MDANFGPTGLARIVGFDPETHEPITEPVQFEDAEYKAIAEAVTS